jgi:hypothetical protein
VLTATFLTGIQNNPDVPSRGEPVDDGSAASRSSRTPTCARPSTMLTSRRRPRTRSSRNSYARLTALQAALGVVVLVGLLGLFGAGGIPRTQPKSAPKELILDPQVE